MIVVALSSCPATRWELSQNHGGLGSRPYRNVQMNAQGVHRDAHFTGETISSNFGPTESNPNPTTEL